jgi:hypothetical protein
MDVLDRELGDARAGVGHGHDQPLLDQLPQRLAQRPAADVEPLRQRGLDQRSAGWNVARQDRVPQPLDDMLAKRALVQAVDPEAGGRRCRRFGRGWENVHVGR